MKIGIAFRRSVNSFAEANHIPLIRFAKQDRKIDVRAAIEFTALSNAFGACEDPQSLQEICDRLGPGNIEVFFQRGLAVLPLTDHDADAG